MQTRFFARLPTHLAVGSNSSQMVFLLDLSYQLFLHLCSTSEQYSPSTSFMSAGHARGAGGGGASTTAVALGAPASTITSTVGGGGGAGAGGGAGGSGG